MAENIIPPKLIHRLQQLLGKPYVLTRPEELLSYECDACVLVKEKPQLVVLPQTAEQVQAIVKLCLIYEVPYVARGSGTGLSGGALAIEHGVIIALNRMSQILSIDPINKTALVEVGVVNAHLNDRLKEHQLFYAPDPSSQAACTIGGNIAENAGGIHCVKYGVTTDHILGLEVVTPNGDLIWLGGNHGHYAQLNWVGLFVGSEGTLGIATKAYLRLMPQPQSILTLLATFSQTEHATDCVYDIIQKGIKPSALEFMDAFTVQAVNAAFDVNFPENAQAVLLVELDGHEEQVEHHQTQLTTILHHHQAQEIRVAETETERLKLWKARKGAVAAYGRILPAFYLHDCVIPRGKLTELLHTIDRIGQKYNVLIGNVFHAGDGNLHPNILLDPNNPDMVDRVLKAGDEILKACLAVGGVLSGEHGIGIEKAHYMPLQFTEQELQVMASIKTALDPNHLCNPGKIFPSAKGCGETRKALSCQTIETAVGWI